MRTACQIITALAVVLVLTATALALNPAGGYGSLTATSNAAVGLPPGKFLQNGVYAKTCLVMVEGAPIRERHDGGSPTTVEGFLWQVGDAFVLNGSEISNFKAIATGADAILRYGASY